MTFFVYHYTIVHKEARLVDSHFYFMTLFVGKKKEVLRLLDVGILDIPIPSPPEQATPVSMLRPNKPSAWLRLPFYSFKRPRL